MARPLMRGSAAWSGAWRLQRSNCRQRRPTCWRRMSVPMLRTVMLRLPVTYSSSSRCSRAFQLCMWRLVTEDWPGLCGQLLHGQGCPLAGHALHRARLRLPSSETSARFQGMMQVWGSVADEARARDMDVVRAQPVHKLRLTAEERICWDFYGWPHSRLMRGTLCSRLLRE